MKNPFKYGKEAAQDARTNAQVKEASEAQARENERLEIKYKIGRIDYDLRLLEDSLKEEPFLHVSAEGIAPMLRVRKINEQEVKRQEDELRKLRADLVRMSAQNLGIQVPDTGIAAPTKVPVVPE